MQNFEIGDTVSLLDEDVSGKVIRVTSKTITVEIDGLDIDFMPGQLINRSAEKRQSGQKTAKATEEHGSLVAQKLASLQQASRQSKDTVDEEESFAIPPAEVHTTGESSSLKSSGFYIICTKDDPKQPENLSLHFANYTSKTVVLIAHEKVKKKYRFLSHAVLPPSSFVKLCPRTTKNFEDWGEINFQLPVIDRGVKELPLPYIFNFKPGKKTFFNSWKSNAPLLRKAAYVVRLTSPEKIVLREIGQESLNLKNAQLTDTVDRPPKVVDLHIEKIHDDHDKLSHEEILNYQFKYFKKHLQNAIALSYDHITFIHGIGSGVLKQRVIDHLTLNPDIQKHKEGPASIFGYGGATQAIIKK